MLKSVDSNNSLRGLVEDQSFFQDCFASYFHLKLWVGPHKFLKELKNINFLGFNIQFCQYRYLQGFYFIQNRLKWVIFFPITATLQKKSTNFLTETVFWWVLSDMSIKNKICSDNCICAKLISPQQVPSFFQCNYWLIAYS